MKLRALCLLVCLLLVAGSTAGCGLFGSKEPASLASVALTDQIDDHTKAPLSNLTEFPAGSTVLYVSALVTAPKKGTAVQAQWWYDRESTGNFTPIDTADVTFPEASREKYVAFSLSAKTTFPPGPYKVKITLDNSQVKELAFTVLQ